MFFLFHANREVVEKSKDRCGSSLSTSITTKKIGPKKDAVIDVIDVRNPLTEKRGHAAPPRQICGPENSAAAESNR